MNPALDTCCLASRTLLSAPAGAAETVAVLMECDTQPKRVRRNINVFGNLAAHHIYKQRLWSLAFLSSRA